MSRGLLWAIGSFFVVYSAYMWFAPQHWYNSSPGVAMMGPFNLHFIRDVAIAFFVSGSALGYGAWKSDKTAAIFGAAWPCFHALFHIWIWTQRGFAIDQIALVNLLGIQAPAWIALWAALRLVDKRAA